MVGICLGTQLIASALGAKVYPNAVKEIGWFPVAIVDAALDHPILRGLNSAMTTFHWHGDTFDMPKGANLLMSSKACKHQAFIYRDKVLGLQFHLEMTEDGIKNLIKHCGAEIIPSSTIQPEEKIISNTSAIPACQRMLFHYWIGLLRTNAARPTPVFHCPSYPTQLWHQKRCISLS